MERRQFDTHPAATPFPTLRFLKFRRWLCQAGGKAIREGSQASAAEVALWELSSSDLNFKQLFRLPAGRRIPMKQQRIRLGGIARKRKANVGDGGRSLKNFTRSTGSYAPGASEAIGKSCEYRSGG
jgi:hypothetical protein